MTDELVITVNGKRHQVQATPDTPLLYVLRNELELNGPRFGCGLEQCGACMVLRGAEAVHSCRRPVGEFAGTQITTLEGLGTSASPHPIQRAFIQEQAAQCGFCLSGVILTAKAFLDQNPRATVPEISQEMSGVLCRCFVNTRMMRAITRYAKERSV